MRFVIVILILTLLSTKGQKNTVEEFSLFNSNYHKDSLRFTYSLICFNASNDTIYYPLNSFDQKISGNIVIIKVNKLFKIKKDLYSILAYAEMEDLKFEYVPIPPKSYFNVLILGEMNSKHLNNKISLIFDYFILKSKDSKFVKLRDIPRITDHRELGNIFYIRDTVKVR